MTRAILKAPLAASLVLFIGILACMPLWSQTDNGNPVERAYPYPLEVVKKGLEQMGGFGGGKLPLIDGFVAASVPQVDRYERPYYQYRVQLNPADRNSTTVRVEARISAWYADPEPAHAQYKSLPSNGRLENDLLDRLQDALGPRTVKPAASVPSGKPPAVLLPADNAARPDSVSPRTKPADPAAKPSGSPSSPQEQLDALLAQRQDVREKTAALLAQIDDRKAADGKSADVAKLASVKHSGVGVMSRKNFGGPVLFRAQAEDEFEVESLESGWALVRLSEGTTAYIQADELNLPAGVVEKPVVATAPGAPPASPKTSEPDLGFWVSREDVNVFSGDWARLKGKKVLFVYAQPRGILSDMAGDDAKLAYTKRVFMSRFRSVTQSATGVEGVVVVFLGSKGGVAAATLTDIQQWVEGGLADEAFVNRCSLDPPDEFRRIHLK
jgi:hypothetical protein